MSLGSVSQTPPEGPIVPPDLTLDTIQQSIDAASQAYTQALQHYNDSKTSYDTVKADIDNFISQNSITSPQSWAPNDPRLPVYNNLLGALEATQADFSDAAIEMLTSATTYVDALARRQIYADQTDQYGIKQSLSTILSLPAPTQLLAGMPAFPALTTEQQTTLSQASSNITTATSGTPAADLLSAFLNMRHNAYLIAETNYLCVSDTLFANDLGYQYLNPNSAVTMDEVDAAKAVCTTDSTNLAQYKTQQATYNTALQDAIATYESAYQASVAPLGAILTTVSNYAAAWQNNLNAVFAQTAHTLELQHQAFIAAEMAALSGGASSDPTSVLNQEALLAEIQRYAEQIANLTEAKISAPTISTPSSLAKDISLADLMRTVSQVQLMTWNLIRSIQSSVNILNSARLRAAIEFLSVYSQELARFNTWAVSVYNANTANKEALNAINIAAYGMFAQTYTQWTSLFTNHLDLLNAAVDSVNAQIGRENANANALVSYANQIQSEIVDAINQERISVPQAEQYLDFTTPSTVTTFPDYTANASVQQIPLIAHFSGSDLPALPVQPPLPDPLPDGFNDSVTQINNAIEVVLPLLNILAGPINQQLTAAGITTPPPLTQLFLIDAQDPSSFALQLNAFQQPVQLLVGFLMQYLKKEATDEEAKQQAALILKMLEGSLSGATATPATSGIGGGLSASSANLFASASAVSRALLQIASSDSFSRLMTEATEVAASLAGLELSGTFPSRIIQPPTGVPGAGAESGTLDSVTTSTLLIYMMAQLMFEAADTQALNKNAITLVQSTPSLSSLTQGELQQVLAALVSLQRNILAFSAIISGTQAGMTPGQLMTTLFPGAMLTSVGSTEQFQAMGFSTEASKSLNAFAIDNATLINTLSSRGYNAENILNILALLAGAQGVVSLTSQVPGGPAFLDNLLASLKNFGIAITAPISSPQELTKQLEAQLNLTLPTTKGVPLGTPTGEALTKFLNSLSQLFSAPTPDTITSALQQMFPSLTATITADFSARDREALVSLQQNLSSETLNDTTIFENFKNLLSQAGIQVSPSIPSLAEYLKRLSTTVTPSVTTALINPTDIMQQYVQQFRALSPQNQQALLASATTFLSQIGGISGAGSTGITAENLAALALAIRLNLVSTSDAANLLNLTIWQAQAQLNNLSAKIAHMLFIPTDEEREQIRDDLRKQQQLIDTKHIDTTILDTLSTDTLQQITLAMKNLYTSFTDKQASVQAYEDFAHSIQRLSNFNTLFVDFLINPSKSIIAKFSLLLAKSTDPRQTQPVIMSG